MNQSTKLGSLSSELRNQTMTQHKEAEGSLFMSAFMKGTLTEESYLRYLYELYNIYEWLEEFLDKHKD
jgi:heme oxygenase